MDNVLTKIEKYLDDIDKEIINIKNKIDNEKNSIGFILFHKGYVAALADMAGHIRDLMEDD